MQGKSNFKKAMAKPGVSSAVTAFIGVAVLMVMFSFLNKNFINGTNLMTLLRSICPYLLVGIGQGIVCITGNIDLSIGSVIGMATMFSSTLIVNGMHAVPAVLITFLACIAVGFLNGVLVGKCQLPPFIATLGTMTIGRGLAELVNGGYNTTDIGSEPATLAFRQLLYYGKVGFVYYIVIITIIVWLIFNFIMGRTRTGRYIYAIGSNQDATRLSGVNVFATITKTYVISALCSFLVGLIMTASSGMGAMQAGLQYEMYGVAAAVIGGISTLGGSGILVGVIAGASVWAILQNGLTLCNVPVAVRNIIIGSIVIACVLMDVMRRNGIITRKKK